MSAWRPAREEDLVRLWPAVRSAHLMASLDELRTFYCAAPWRVRISDAGDALVLRRWRAHLDALAIRSAWAPPKRMAWLLDEAKRVARAQGYGSLVSPLVPCSSLGPYRDAGMHELEPLVALQGPPRRVATGLPVSIQVGLRPARPVDIGGLVALDSQCFADFWRYGSTEFEDVLAHERVTIAERAGEIVGYSTCVIAGSTCTLGRLGVAPLWRQQGVGSSLLRDVAAWAARSKALTLSLCTQEDNRASRALYWRAGLIEVDERYVLARCPMGEGAERLH